MNTTMISQVRSAAAATGCALALGFGAASVGAERSLEDNYFVRHPGPAAGRTEIDPFDHYAPADLSAPSGNAGSSDASQAATGYTAGPVEFESAWDVPSSPGLPGKPY
ncbi:MAG: hypothetical protein ACR2LS_04895 [Thermomicrobiales bacterium]|jgi:hypothetical protein